MLLYPKIFTQSKWDSIVDWQVADNRGVKATIIRVGSVDGYTGIPYEDYQFTNHATGAILARKPAGYYWYLRPKFSGAMQATAFCDYLLKVYAPPIFVPWIVDVEEPGLSPTQAADEVHNFIEVASTRLFHKGLIYNRQSQWDGIIAPSYAWNKQDLHAARYNVLLSSPWSDGKCVYRDWNEWKIWQFTDMLVATDWGYNPFLYNPYNIDPLTGQSRGYSKEAEMNYFNGTDDELVAYFGNQYQDPSKTNTEQIANKLIELESSVNTIKSFLHGKYPTEFPM